MVENSQMLSQVTHEGMHTEGGKPWVTLTEKDSLVQGRGWPGATLVLLNV